MPRILLIDDDELFRTMMCEMLEDAGYDVVDAATSAEGIEMYRRREFDLIITDLFIPPDGGLGVIKYVRDRDAKIGIIVISGMVINNRIAVLDQTLQVGANKALPKPISQENMLQSIEEVLAQSAEV